MYSLSSSARCSSRKDGVAHALLEVLHHLGMTALDPLPKRGEPVQLIHQLIVIPGCW